MDNLNVVNDTHKTVVESYDMANDGDSVTQSGTPEVCEDAVVTHRTQSAAENSGFRKLRLENERLRRQIDAMSDYEAIKTSNGKYLDMLVNDMMSRDLETIKKLNPDITGLESLGEDFLRLIESGLDAKSAYTALYGATDGKGYATPPKLGSVGGLGNHESRYFTSRELDRLSLSDLENPKIFKKAMESLKRL